MLGEKKALNVANVVHYLKTQGALNKEYDPNLAGLIPTSKLGFSFGWELISNVSSSNFVEFTNLSGDYDKIYYLIVATWNSDSTTARPIYIQFNNDTTIGRYCWTNWINNAGTITTASQGYNSTTGIPAILVHTMNTNCIGLINGIIFSKGIVNLKNGVTSIPTIFHSFDCKLKQTNTGGSFIKSSPSYNNEPISSIKIFTNATYTVAFHAFLFKLKS